MNLSTKLIWFSLCFILILSCQKESKNQIKQTEFSNFNAQEALNSYLNFRKSLNNPNLSNTTISTNNLKTNQKKDILFEILNDSPYESNTKDYSFVEFKIKYKYDSGLIPDKGTLEENQKFRNSTLNKLLIKKNKKSGIIDYELIAYIPTKDYLKNYSITPENFIDHINSNFNGFILHKNIGGEIILLENIINGVVEKKMYPQRNTNVKLKVSGLNTSSATDGCGQICYYTPYYDDFCRCWVDDWQCFTGCEPPYYPGVSLDNGMLAFESNQAFYDLYNQLDNEVETYNANFYDQKGSLTDDQVETIEIQQNFDEYKPLRDFENYFSFASLRQKIETEENAWMENITLDPNTDPDAIYTGSDEVIQSFFNQNQSVKIAGIYTGTPSDNEYATNASGSNGTTCRTHKRYHQFSDLYNNDSKRAKYVASFNGFYLGIFSSRIVARTKNYKKKSNGHWKKFATICKARILGYVVDNNCSGEKPFFTTYKPEKRRRSYKSSRIEFFATSYIKSGDMIGEHYVGSNANTLYFSQALTW
nr:hypothetical protein [Pseudopedobacter sp.]